MSPRSGSSCSPSLTDFCHSFPRCITRPSSSTLVLKTRCNRFCGICNRRLIRWGPTLPRKWYQLLAFEKRTDSRFFQLAPCLWVTVKRACQLTIQFCCWREEVDTVSNHRGFPMDSTFILNPGMDGWMCGYWILDRSGGGSGDGLECG